MWKSLLVFTVCGALTACATAPASTEQTEREVERASDAFQAARQRGDAAAFAAHFTDDGVYMVPGIADAAGRDAIRDLAQKRFAGGRTDEFRILQRDIEVAGDSAWEVASFSEADRRPSQSFRMKGRHLIHWKRGSDGVWRVHRYLYNFSDATPLS